MPTRSRALRALAGLGVLGVITGCAVANEGAVDYRKAEIVAPQPAGARVGPMALEPAAGPEVIPAQAQAAANGPLAPAALRRQALRGEDPAARIEPGDSISIHLRTAFLKDFEALLGHPLRGFRPNGEIAIVVKAFEFGTGQDFSFGPGSDRQGRLVYYSPDVEKGQVLNFANLPVYGPITYNGNPVGIDIFVIEIDANDAQVAALLSTLATLGAQAYPPAAPVLPVLNALGKSLLNGDTDDIELRFTMMLNPGAGYDGVSHPTVEAGDYVFVKQEDRRATTPWQDLTVDTNTGLLYRGDEPYRESTFLTFQINRNLSSTDLDLAQNTYGQFIDKLKQEDRRKADELGAFLGEVEKIGVARVQARQFDQARQWLTTWRNDRFAQAPEAQGRARRAAFKLVKLLDDSIKAKPDANAEAKTAAPLSSEQIDYLLNQLAEMANARTQAALNVFTRTGFSAAAQDFDALFAMTEKPNI